MNEPHIPSDQRSHGADHLIARSQQIGEDIDVLFGQGSNESFRFHELAGRYHDEWKRLAGNHGLDHPAIAFVGPSESGKSTLVNLLMGREDVGGERIRWIGPQAPQDPHPAWEEALLVPAQEMPELGAPYMLVDTPGSAWQSLENPVFQTLLSVSRLKVLVLRGNKTTTVEWQRMAAAFKGSLVLPVIRMEPEEAIAYADNHEPLIERWHDQTQPDLAAHLAGVTFEEPVFIADFRTQGGWQLHASKAKEALTDALRRFLSAHRPEAFDRKVEMAASWQRFLEALKPLVRQFGGQLAAERSRELDLAIARLPGDIVHTLLAEDRPLRAWFRLDARADLMNRISPLAFPFRPIASLLCVTTGSWDRLILASAGSVPSAFLTLAGGLRQKKEDLQATSHHKRTPALFKSVARRQLAEPWGSFMAAMKKAGIAVENHDDPLTAIRITGEEELLDAWMLAKQNASKPKGRCPAIAVGISAGLATMLFWSLMLGPLVHTYGQYIPASIRSLFGEWTHEALAAYPAMTASFWFSAIIISIVPCLLVALCLVGWWLRNNRAEVFLGDLKSAMDDNLRQHNAGLRVEATHPQLAAYRNLIQFSLLEEKS
jgi:hypothetical protein